MVMKYMGVSVKWLGHASFRISADGKVIYIDPYAGDYREKADIILVTHSHFDHCDKGKIRMISKSDTTIVAPEECAGALEGDVRLAKAGEKITIGDVEVKVVHAYNVKRFRSPGKPFHPKGFGVGYLIGVGGKVIYHAGDTDFIPEMKEMGKVDLALLPSGDTYTMNNLEASEAALTINPKFAIPMHRWDADPEEFKRMVEKQSGIKVILLGEGEKFNLE